ncbi:hypothetical protein G4888_12085 [Blautia wexlerae]|uniref:hypothetical protein n=1 Tax=Blautia wexlerae TaxID=418240 RepID=UPI00156FDF39|nr:hypothetical protein [Blautia wexlerae]NSF64465.1 hypothetical protein [Blautia wexlerae]
MNSENNKKQDFVKEIFVLILLMGLIVVRFFPIGDDNTFIKCIGFIGVLVSLGDLYVDADKLYSSYDKFNIIRGLAYLLAIILAIILVLLLTEVIPIDSKWSDVFTLLALMISLPEKWYLNKIGKYITKGKR